MTSPGAIGRSRRVGIGVALVVLMIGAVSILAWRVSGDPRVALLSPRAPAEWIVFPWSPRIGIPRGVSLDTRFRKEFELPRRSKNPAFSVISHCCSALYKLPPVQMPGPPSYRLL